MFFFRDGNPHCKGNLVQKGANPCLHLSIICLAKSAMFCLVYVVTRITDRGLHEAMRSLLAKGESLWNNVLGEGI